MMNRQILSLVLCAWTLVTPGVFGARGADAAAAVVRGTRPVDPGKARVTFVIHVYNGLIGTLAWAPLKAEFEKRGYACKIVHSPRVDTRPDGTREDEVAAKRVRWWWRIQGYELDLARRGGARRVMILGWFPR